MHFHREEQVLTLSVTEIAELAFPAGDLSVAFRSFPRVSASARAAFLLQYGKEEGFTAPLSLTLTLPYTVKQDGRDAFLSEQDDLSSAAYRLLGEADGLAVSTQEGQPDRLYLLCPTGGYDAGGGFRRRFRATLALLGYLYCASTGKDSVILCSLRPLPDDRFFSEEELCSLESLSAYTKEILHQIEPMTGAFLLHRALAVPQAGEVPFPYPSMRDGQEELIRSVYTALRRGSRLFAQAPTGIGKTMSTLYPAVRALGNGHVDKIFYLTAKNSTRREAFRAAGDLFRAGARLRTCVITSKEQVCLCERAGRSVKDCCNPFDCPYADGYYERAPHAVMALLSRQNGYPRSLIVEIAREYRVCPYELSLDLSEKCDLVICDYNYAFDPIVYFRRYFGEERTVEGRYAFLVDEGHNLADRAREMYSSSLKRNRVRNLIDLLSDADLPLRKTLTAYIEVFDRLRLLCDDTLTARENGEETGFWMSKEAPTFLDDALASTENALKEWLRSAREHPCRAALSELYGDIRKYRLLRGYYDEHFLTMVRVQAYDVEVRLFCLDPSQILDELLSRAHASVVFSATLTPLDYFVEVLGGGKRAATLSLPSPFPQENLCVAAVDALSTRYEGRDTTYRSIASLIAATVSGKRGNYIVYFPSYAYLDKTVEVFRARYPKVKTVVQERNMSQKEKERFLDAFLDDGKMRVGFCVLGGSFSEGVDLPGGRLIGAVIVGVGLPGLSEEGNILREYYENRTERGYDYAYTFPGMNRVLQAAGRVIRTDTDRGVVVLIDDRYAQPLYRSLFPKHWGGLQYAGNPASLAEIVRRFWAKSDKEEPF